ncbi:hypothetical protein MBOT_14700 [Mycobacterium botniense]|uniref:Uncharacterized protein n=1 Tax=Mycobacterium botniense TaxID=84962 RepID=A0A7I9XWE5_9MYCO|nr:hypothetical protein MBOT_14700 [Mycobacterium botniense]
MLAAGSGRPGPTVWVARLNEGVVVPVMVVIAVRSGVSAECKSAEEDDRDDEHDSGNDRDPGRGLIEPVRLLRCRIRRRWRGGSPPGGGFWCFSHASNNAPANTSDSYVLVMYWL